MRDVAPYLVDRYSERRESAEELTKRVNQKTFSTLRGTTLQMDGDHSHK